MDYGLCASLAALGAIGTYLLGFLEGRVRGRRQLAEQIESWRREMRDEIRRDTVASMRERPPSAN